MIEFFSVGKTYRSLPGRRAVAAVAEFSLSVQAGEVLGLAGPNGAGKSTLIGLLLGYLRPSAGRVAIDGLRPRAYVEHHGIGYLSELVAIPPGWRTEHALARFALLAGVAPARVPARVEAVIQQLELGEHRHKLIKQLSKGNLQRVGLAQTLLCDERVIIFDEPTHGLDPMWTQRFRELVRSLRRPDRIILIASHNLDELQRVSDRVAIIDHGRLQRVVDLGPADGSGRQTPYRLVVGGGGEYVDQVFPDAIRSGYNEFDLPGRPLEQLNRQLSDLIARGGLVLSIAPTQTALEQQFREAVGR